MSAGDILAFLSPRIAFFGSILDLYGLSDKYRNINCRAQMRKSTPLYCHKMAEPTDINTVFASTISLLRVLQGYHKQTLTIRELQDQLLALSMVLLLLINGADHVVEICQLYKHPLLRCGERCDYLKKIMSDSTATAENLCWNRIFRHTRDMLCTYTSTFIIGFAGNNFPKVIATPGIIRTYRKLIQYTISDLDGAEEWFGDLSPSETDKNAFLSICVESSNSSYGLQPKKIEAIMETQGIGTTEPNKMVFCTPEEAFGNTADWERNLQACFYSLRDKFEVAFKSVPDTLSARDIAKHFGHLGRESGTQQRFIVIGEDLTKPHQIIDLCGVLLLYDISYKI